MSNMQCDLIQCQNRDISEQDARIEVETALPSGGLKKLKLKLIIDWTARGQATFHLDCWDSVLKSARARSKKKMTCPYILDVEKSMIKEASKTSERHDSSQMIASEGKRIADMLRKAKQCVCFTGAGISTSAGIGDYRGKSGKWTEMDREKVNIDAMVNSDDQEESPRKRARLNSEHVEEEEEEEQEEDGVPYEKLRPTYTHESLAKLMEDGYLKYCISQNGDGLHTLSGIAQDKISELHGNVFEEKCEKCGHRYERSYYVMDDQGSQYFEELSDFGKTDIKKPSNAKQCSLCGLSHRTGRKCEQINSKGKLCPGHLMDTIINFRDNLEEPILERAYKYAEQCDLMLCLGTTLTVTPASELVEIGQEPLKIVICNRQKTHMDSQAVKVEKGKQLGSRVFGDCDRLFKEIMKCLYEKEDLKKWENARAERMMQYDAQRVE